MQKRATIKDVAALAGVGISVVSYVLNDTPGQSLPVDTRQRVKDAARQLNYIPNSIARGMRSSKTMVLGILSFWEGNGTIFDDVLKGAVKQAAKSDYSVMICNNDGKFGYIDYYLKRRVDGFILLAPPADHLYEFVEQEHVVKLKEKDIPFVIVNGRNRDSAGHRLFLDHFATAYAATQYLIGLGHRKIGYVDTKFQGGYINSQKLKGFRAAMDENGLDSSHVFIVKDLNIKDVVENTKLTGLVAHFCDVAHEILEQAIRLQIKIPEQISVIAANTHPYAPYLHPPLTTVRYRTVLLGIEAAEMLFDLINHTQLYVPRDMSVYISEMESCRKI